MQMNGCRCAAKIVGHFAKAFTSVLAADARGQNPTLHLNKRMVTVKVKSVPWKAPFDRKCGKAYGVCETLLKISKDKNYTPSSTRTGSLIKMSRAEVHFRCHSGLKDLMLG